jgi:hypothetical protein
MGVGNGLAKSPGSAIECVKPAGRKLPLLAKSPILQVLLRLLEDGSSFNKLQAATALECHQRTAQRYLSSLHAIGFVRICGYQRCNGGALPSYVKSDGKGDAPAPQPLSPSRRARRYRKVHKEYLQECSRHKWATQKALSGKVRIGIWGL